MPPPANIDGRAMSGRRIPKWLSAIIWILALLLIAATLIPLINTNQWWLRVFIFPQAQFTILLLLVALAVPFLLDMRRSAPKILLITVAASLVYQLQYLLPYTPLWPVEARTAQACPAEKRLRLLILNVQAGDNASAQTLSLVRRTAPDLFLAVETESAWVRAMAPLQDRYPQVVSAPREDAWGMMLYSRLPLVSPKVRYLVEDYVPSIKTGVRLPSGDIFTFYGLHPKPPLMHDSTQGDAELIRAGREIRNNRAPAILAGDLNDVPWGRTNQLFQMISGMADPRVGRAFDASFKVDNPIARWPLDHVFVTPEFGVLAFEPLGDVGSDHFPVLAELCYRPTVAAA